MKILALNGSHRGDQGHTRFLLDRLASGAISAGAECEIVSLARRKINRCLGCGQCQTVEHTLHCAYREKDDTAAIFARMAQADLLIYATPVYVFGMSSLLKAFIERFYGICDCAELRVTQSGLFFHHVDAAVCSKPFVALVCCDNLENVTPHGVVAYFETFSRFMDAPQMGTLIRNGGLLCGHGRDPSALERFPRLREVYAAYEQAGRELATLGRIRPATQRRANQEIVPVPFFGILKNLRPFKRVMVGRAQQMIGGH